MGGQQQGLRFIFNLVAKARVTMEDRGLEDAWIWGVAQSAPFPAQSELFWVVPLIFWPGCIRSLPTLS